MALRKEKNKGKEKGGKKKRLKGGVGVDEEFEGLGVLVGASQGCEHVVQLDVGFFVVTTKLHLSLLRVRDSAGF